VAEDKVARLEARTALRPPEAVELDAQREVAAAEPDAQPEAAVAAEPVAQQGAVAAAEPVAQPEAVVAAEPVAQQQAVAAAEEPVAQQQVVVAAAAAAMMQPGVRPLVASVELAETAAVRFWIREASILVRAPE